MHLRTLLTLIITIWLGNIIHLTTAFPLSPPTPLSPSPGPGGLKRRTSEKLSSQQFSLQGGQALREMRAAFAKNPALQVKVMKALGVKKLTGQEGVSATALNMALKASGYEGTLFPEPQDLADASRGVEEGAEEGKRDEDKEEEKIRQTLAELATALGDVRLLRKVRKALGLKTEGPPPAKPYTAQRWNRALKKAGYQGPLLPESDPEKKYSLDTNLFLMIRGVDYGARGRRREGAEQARSADEHKAVGRAWWKGVGLKGLEDLRWRYRWLDPKNLQIPTSRPRLRLLGGGPPLPPFVPIP